MKYWLIAGSIALFVGCSFNEGGISADATGATPDGPISDALVTLPDARVNDASATDPDANVPPPDGPVPDASCSGAPPIVIDPSNFDKCGLAASNGTLTATPGRWLINTDDVTLEDPTNPPQPVDALIQNQSGGPQLVVLLFDSVNVQIGATLSIRGSRPVAIVTSGDITVAGQVYAGANLQIQGPGGGLASFCTTGTGEDGGIADNTGAGGGGGGYGAVGGTGAAGENTAGSVALAGTSEGNATLIPLRGGCSGGSGGNSGALAGGGGGAVQLVADGTITITGGVVARGGAGAGADGIRTGGGGGGSGGAILIESSDVTVSGYLSANGGGGGEGSYSGGMFAGNNGNNGTITLLPALGGIGGGFGGDGGAGGVSTTPAGPGLEATSTDTPGGGGGGGGGGVGRIHFNVTNLDTLAATITPPAG